MHRVLHSLFGLLASVACPELALQIAKLLSVIKVQRSKLPAQTCRQVGERSGLVIAADMHAFDSLASGSASSLDFVSYSQYIGITA